MKWQITERTEWKHWMTPKVAREKAVHRWYLFPHSFTGEFVHSLVDEWSLAEQDEILDPFVGAGTTLLAAKEKNIPATGYDLSPLAVLAANTKTATFSRERLDELWRTFQCAAESGRASPMKRTYPELIQKALPGGRLEAFDTIAGYIDDIDGSSLERDFFRLALISIIPHFSHAVANGGWLRWLNQGASAENVWNSFTEQVELMLADVRDSGLQGDGNWEARIADARVIPASDAAYSAVITSPPYPNRHDYTRVFGIELMFAFHDWEANRALRYQTFHSHPEARPKRPSAEDYEAPESLEKNIRNLSDQRLQRMLRGYFFDMYLCLCEVRRVCCAGGKIAFVVGNARYAGSVIPVDEYTAEMGERAGLICREIRVTRWRGNSAQQMGKYGRTASRESIVIFEKR